MLGNCDEIITPVSSTTNQWPQNQIVLDDHKSFMASSSSNKAMAAEKPINPDPQNHHPLKCPRCDSSNTKFCYYNNYSLSQPRHFCKACKRYWTRGGTLRNVPVGGGCRKNKRSKRHTSGGGDGISTATASPSVQSQIDLPPASNHVQNPLFYGLPTNPLELNFPFSSFRVSSDTGGFNLHPQISDLGLGFASDNGYKNGFKPVQDIISNSTSPPFSASANNHSLFSGYSSSFSTSSTMASLLASTLQQQHQKLASKDIGSPYTIPRLMPYEDPQVKAEGENRFSWNPNPNPNPNPNSDPIDQINSSDPSSTLLWNTTSMSSWFDPSTMGSSVPSLI